MELSNKIVFAILFFMALSISAQARLRFRHRSQHKVLNKNLKSLVKSRQGGSFCDNHCLAIFIYPSTVPLYVNHIEIPFEDDNNCHEDRFEGANLSLKLSESVKVRYPEIFKGVYPNRAYESGENFQALKAQYSEYMKDLHLLYKTSDIENIAKCYFGGTKEPVDPCSYTKVCGASFGGTSCVKFDGHCHSTCSACCFLSAEADTIKETEEEEFDNEPELEMMEEEGEPLMLDTEDTLPHNIEIDEETGLTLEQKRKRKASLAKAKKHGKHAKKHAKKHTKKGGKKVALAHRRYKKQDNRRRI